MRNVDLSLVSDYVMPAGVGELANRKLCVVSQANMLDALSRGEAITAASDALECACPVLRVLAICLNDVGWWTSDTERTETLRPLIPALLDSKVPPEQQAERARLASAFARFAADTAAKSAECGQYAAEYAEDAAKSAAKSAEYAEYAARNAAESAAESAMYAAVYAAVYAESVESLRPLRDELLRVWWNCEAVR